MGSCVQPVETLSIVLNRSARNGLSVFGGLPEHPCWPHRLLGNHRPNDIYCVTLTGGSVILYAYEDDLWRIDLAGKDGQRLTEGRALKWLSANPASDEWQQALLYRPPQVSPDGRWMTLSQTGRDLLLLDLLSGSKLSLSKPGGPTVAWAPNSNYFAFGDRADLYIYDVNQKQLQHLLTVDEGDGRITTIVWSPDGRFVAYACCFVTADAVYQGNEIGIIQKVELETGRIESQGEVTASVGGGSSPLCWSTDGQTVAAQDAACPTNPLPPGISPDRAMVAALSPLSAEDVYWEYGSLLTVSDLHTGDILWEQELPNNITAKRVAWSPDGAYLLLEDDDYVSPIWRLKAKESSDIEIVIPEGLLIDVIPQWSR